MIFPLKNSKFHAYLGQKTISILSVLVAMTSVTLGAAFAKKIFPLIGATGMATLRITIAAIILCLFVRPWKEKLIPNAMRSIVVYGICLGAMNLLFYQAIGRIPLGIAIAIEFLGPLGVALFASRGLRDFIWVVFCAGGLTLIFLPNATSSAPLDSLGIVFAFAAALAWAFYIVQGRKVSQISSSATSTSIGLIVAAIFILPFGIWESGRNLLNFSVMPTAIFVAIFSSIIPYTLEMGALKHLSAKNFGILMSLEPALGVLAGVFFLREYLNGIQYLGIACIMIASIGSSLTLTRAEISPA